MSIYRWLLRRCAPDLSREYGHAMEETFEVRLLEARSGGRWRWLLVLVRELAALVALAASGWLEPAARARRHREHCASQWKAGPMHTFGQEFGQAARRLLRAPSFTCASVLTLALAIGANGAIFGVVERVMLNPLPYPASDRLIELDHGELALNIPSDIGITSGLFLHYVNRSQTLESAAIYQTSDETISDAAGPERIRVTRATPSLAAVLRVAPVRGRWFTTDEGVPGARSVVVLSHGLWTRRYGRDPNIVGRSLAIGNASAEIVGVMPASFAFPDPRDELWMALPLTPAPALGFGTRWEWRASAMASRSRRLRASCSR